MIYLAALLAFVVCCAVLGQLIPRFLQLAWRRWRSSARLRDLRRDLIYGRRGSSTTATVLSLLTLAGIAAVATDLAYDLARKLGLG